MSNEVRVPGSAVIELDHGITVSLFEAQTDDPAHLIWIDTVENTGRIRIRLNDADPLYNGDPEKDEQPMAAFRKAFESSILEVLDEIEASTEAEDMDPVFEARDAAGDLLAGILNRLRKETS